MEAHLALPFNCLKADKVTESGSNSNYTSKLSKECSGNMREGESKKCTITNTYSEPPPPVTTANIIVTKKVINEGGGDREPSDFTITVDGNNPNPSSFDGSSSGTSVSLEPGSYSITESSLPEYTSSKSGDCAGSLSTGETKQCTITNINHPIDKSAQLIVINNVINNDGSEITVKPSAFIITVHGNDPLPRSFPGKTGEGVIVNLNPGRYSVTADGPDGYTSDYSEGCEGTIRQGDAKACIITNEEITTPSPMPPQPPQHPLPTIETITGFSGPYGVALNLDNGLIYVSNYGQFNTTGTVSVINGTTNDIVASIPVGKNPQAIVYNPANGQVYTANVLSNTLSIINGTSNSLVGSIDVGAFPGKNPTGITLNPINNYIYVTNMGSNTVSVINGTTNTVVANIPVGLGPNCIAYDQNNGDVYVANSVNDTISIVDGLENTVISTISLGNNNNPNDISYNINNDRLFVTNTNSSTVSAIENQ
jgi:YVTN family beta-propeller protein